MSKHEIEEARRCLQCKNPLCKKHCPVQTPVNEVINAFLDGQIIEAGRQLFLNNPLSAVCALVCPVESLCEGNCILGKKQSPVQISLIEGYISDYYLSSMNLLPPATNNHKIAIIGSGPAGITIAFIMASKGFQITIFEANDKIGGVMRYGIADFRLPKDLLEKFKAKLLEMGVKIRPNTLIGPALTLEELFRDGYRAIFIGTGVWNPKKLGIKGESLGHVHYAIDYLRNPDVYDLGKKICVIGAGNVAIDVARTILRKGGKEVSILYHRGPETMSAQESELEYAKIDGVKFEYWKKPLEITDEGVKYITTREVVGSQGFRELEDIPGTEDIFPVDSIIVAVSQGPRSNIVSTAKGITLNRGGLVITDEAGRTSLEGIFASGDVVTGAKTVVEAVSFSKKTAQAMEEYVLHKYGGG